MSDQTTTTRPRSRRAAAKPVDAGPAVAEASDGLAEAVKAAERLTGQVNAQLAANVKAAEEIAARLASDI